MWENEKEELEKRMLRSGVHSNGTYGLLDVELHHFGLLLLLFSSTLEQSGHALQLNGAVAVKLHLKKLVGLSLANKAGGQEWPIFFAQLHISHLGVSNWCRLLERWRMRCSKVSDQTETGGKG